MASSNSVSRVLRSNDSDVVCCTLSREDRKNRRLLVIAPHADDEVIGCGGTIAKAAAGGARVDLVVMAVGGVRHRHVDEAVPIGVRQAELAASSKVLGIASSKVLYSGHEMHLEAIPMFDLVSALDAVLDEGYDEIYLPPADHNSDHRRTHEAAVAALRPGARPTPAMIAVYETLSGGWPVPAGGWVYVDIAEHIDSKLAALRCYASQIQAYPHPRSVEAVRGMAAFRAAEIGRDACERFTLLRMVR
jgi:N-acetylglucosamine malate deacetylase 1